VTTVLLWPTRREIQQGSLGPGALLPSGPELARDYNVSRQTARSALQALEREGLVVVRPRRGRIVRSTQRLRWHLSEFERPDQTVLSTSDAWETDIEAQGHDPTQQDLQVERITPPDSIAMRLNLDPKTDVCVVRRHICYIDGKPAIISDDYFDERIVEGTELAEPEDTTRENILAEAGYEQVYDIDEIITRMPHTRRGRTAQHRHRNTRGRAHPNRLHRHQQASTGHGVDHPGGHADPAVHHPDLSPPNGRPSRVLSAPSPAACL
jgi:GntR family transcriptional regulator